MLVSCYFHSWFGLGFVDSKPNIDCHRVSELESLRKDFAAIQHSWNIFLNLTTKDQNNGSQWICQQGAFDLFAACLNWTFNKLKRFVIPEDFPLITSVISHTRNVSIVLRHPSSSLPPSGWRHYFVLVTQHIMDVVIASIFLQDGGGGGELLQEGPASFLQGVPVRAHCPPFNTQNQEPQLPGSRVKASLDIKQKIMWEPHKHRFVWRSIMWAEVWSVSKLELI